MSAKDEVLDDFQAFWQPEVALLRFFRAFVCTGRWPRKYFPDRKFTPTEKSPRIAHGPQDCVPKVASSFRTLESLSLEDTSDLRVDKVLQSKITSAFQVSISTPFTHILVLQCRAWACFPLLCNGRFAGLGDVALRFRHCTVWGGNRPQMTIHNKKTKHILQDLALSRRWMEEGRNRANIDFL